MSLKETKAVLAKTGSVAGILMVMGFKTIMKALTLICPLMFMIAMRAQQLLHKMKGLFMTRKKGARHCML